MLTLTATLFAFAALAREVVPEAIPKVEALVVDQTAGLAVWQTIHEVFTHPRCTNCHGEDDSPGGSGPH